MKTSKKIMWTAVSIVVMFLLITLKILIIGTDHTWVSAVLGAPFGVIWFHIWDKGDL